ncbi:MAG: BamA/TamA family outer membrane protein [Paludibacteraceae bacterium]|nr:BamA/TamA family outer membrane protein [Paludibacteraceae bacterium]
MKRVLPILMCICMIFSSCSVTKYVPDNEYLLNKVKISADNKKVNETDMTTYLRQTPNPKLFDFINFNLALYSLSGRDTSLWINRFLRKIGDEPVIYDSILTKVSANELRKQLNNKGYYNASVTTDVKLRKKKASVHYDLHCGEPYRIRKIDYLIRNKEIKSLILSDSANFTIHEGDIFDIDKLESERERIASHLRNNGYFYFDKEYIGVVADSSLGTHQVDFGLTVRPMRRVVSKNTFESVPHETYRVRDIRYYSVNRTVDLLVDSIVNSLESTSYKDYKIYSSVNFVRPSVLYKNTFIEKDSLYNESTVAQTYAKLTSLKIFKYQNISFTPVPDSLTNDSVHWLDCNIVITPTKAQSFSVEVEGTNNEGDFGIAGKLSYIHGNIFHGGEIFKFGIRGANESILMSRSIWDISTQASLNFPNLWFPNFKKNYKRTNPANTELYVNFSYQIRQEYIRTIAGAGMRYRWQSENKINHQVDLLDFNYVYLPYIQESFADTIKNSLLKYSYEDHMILRTGYGISYTNQHLRNTHSTYTLRGNFEIGGNLLYGICVAANAPKDELGSYVLGNIPFSQYAKVNGDFTYNQYVDEKNSMVYHLALGVGVPYLNSKLLPFEKRYYGGGANHVRGWSARTLGPGGYDPGSKTDYMKQSGDINLCMNLEYRTHLVWKLELAAFIDAGNIWTLADEGQGNGQFKWDTFYKQIALGYGIGLRLNFDYFVVRLDWGLKAFDPKQEPAQQWRFTNTWGLADMALHFAVGYPF